MVFWLCIPHEKSEAYLRKNNCPSNPPFETSSRITWSVEFDYMCPLLKCFVSRFLLADLLRLIPITLLVIYGDLKWLASAAISIQRRSEFSFWMLRNAVGKCFICGAYNGTNYQLLPAGFLNKERWPSARVKTPWPCLVDSDDSGGHWHGGWGDITN